MSRPYNGCSSAVSENIDLGCIRYTNKKGEKCHRYFLNCVNVGLIASIMNLRRKTHHVFGSRSISFISLICADDIPTPRLLA